MSKERDKPRRPRLEWEPPSKAVLFLIALAVALAVACMLVWLVNRGSTMGSIGSFYSQPIE